MGFWLRVLVVAVSLGVAVIVKNYRDLSRPLPAPVLNVNEYWGAGSAVTYKEDKTVRPFDIGPKAELIDELKTELGRPLKLHEPLEGTAFEYGFNSHHLKTVVAYWRDSYMPKWGEREAFLKQFPHFRTQIQGLNIHFLHVKPKATNGKKVLPLLLLHGWPGSVREFYELIPLLTTPNDKSDYIYEVIAPSLPGYGWSQAASKINFGPVQMAVVMRNLMMRLGHEHFVVQGGDWGSMVGSATAALFPQNVLGYHSNMCGNGSPLSFTKMILTALWPRMFVDKEFVDYYKPLGDFFSHMMEEMGYAHIQATKPDTIGTALTHNPVGLAAYILEKFSTWTNPAFKQLPDGGLTKRYTLDALLDNVMIYYITNSITTSARLYAEALGDAQRALQIDRVEVTPPSGCARFRHELMHSSDSQLRGRFVNLVHSSYHGEGGHFAAMELPQQLYADFVEFSRKAFGNKS